MPIKLALNCTMPAEVNSRVGSERGISGLDGMTGRPLDWKNCKKLFLTSVLFICFPVLRAPLQVCTGGIYNRLYQIAFRQSGP